ncbi:HPr family phosphocarrier protein [Neobacillus cucumis]|uniref:HPr family phosphocarrier protein n=1 Tax=Neobacillus cucumis TaxID=1740721 RepID=UPI00203B1D0C|nr:HPr family phosphocarrier protein [Neobacillus cucumis]MCM3726586.1 HPr family phosphocarrier protein [Neobacillus cucumis]
MPESIFRVTDAAGIHARPATVLVHTSSQFKSAFQIHYNDRSANLKSILGVLALAIRKNAERALASLQDVIEKEGIAIGGTFFSDSI